MSAACTAIPAVSASRTSPTMITSGSWRSSVRTPAAKSRPMPGWTCIWLNAGSTSSIGSSIVHTFTSGRATCFSVEYKVVVLPEPVGPVTRITPCGCSTIERQVASSSASKPSSRKFFSSTTGSKMRITSFSPNAVGMVDSRNSTSSPDGARVFRRPSCGRRFSAMSMRPRILRRDNTGAYTDSGRQDLVRAERAWERYVKLTDKPDQNVASLMVQAYGPGALNQPGKAVRAMEIVIDSRKPTGPLYAQLAVLAYQAKQTRKAELATQKAVQLTPKDQRQELRDQLQQARVQASGQLSGGDTSTDSGTSTSILPGG